MKYTKGKWAWQTFGSFYKLTAQHGMREIILSANIIGDDGNCYVSMNKDGILYPIDPNQPNAKLISKAPEMYEALKEAKTILHHKFISLSEDELDYLERLMKLLKEIES